MCWCEPKYLEKEGVREQFGCRDVPHIKVPLTYIRIVQLIMIQSVPNPSLKIKQKILNLGRLAEC